MRLLAFSANTAHLSLLQEAVAGRVFAVMNFAEAWREQADPSLVRQAAGSQGRLHTRMRANRAGSSAKIEDVLLSWGLSKTWRKQGSPCFLQALCV